jgi:hypothetical protein
MIDDIRRFRRANVNEISMSPTTLDDRPLQPSVMAIYRPIEQYWATYGPVDGATISPEQVLEPLDAFLMHLVLGMTPAPAVLVDRAASATFGSTSLLALRHPNVRRVVAVAGGESGQLEAQLTEFGSAAARQRDGTLAALEVVDGLDWSRAFGGRPPVVVVYDARSCRADNLVAVLEQDMNAWPDALALFLGLGWVGECPAIEALMRHKTGQKGTRFRLMRETAEVLGPSRLGMMCRNDHPYANEITERIRGLYTSNYSYLDMLRRVSDATLTTASGGGELRKDTLHTLARHHFTRKLSSWVFQRARGIMRKYPAVQRLVREIRQ